MDVCEQREREVGERKGVIRPCICVCVFVCVSVIMHMMTQLEGKMGKERGETR